MDSFYAGFPSRFDNLWDIEIALRGRAGANGIGFVCTRNMSGFQIGFRVDSDSFYSELLACPDYPEGDLAPICDQDFPEH